MAQSVQDIMTTDVVTVEANSTVREAAQQMQVGTLSLGDLAPERDPTSALAEVSADAPSS